MLPTVSISVASEQTILNEKHFIMLMETRLGIWKGLSRNGLFLLLRVWSLSQDNLEALGEASDGGRKHQKGLFTHVSGAWAGKDSKARGAGHV